MKDLLKEAIADAKAVRETALQNAKLALEEAFTPRLQSMISAKLAEEMAEDDEPTDQEIPAGEGAETGGEGAEGAPAAETNPDNAGAEGETEPEVKEEGEFGEKDGGEGVPDTREPEDTENGEGSDDLDLDEIIKELELDSSEIGDGNNDVDAEKPAHDDVNPTTEGETETAPEGSEGDEDINIDEIVASLREADESETETEKEKESKEKEAELEEAYNVIRFLKGKINEVNSLNAKLLYSNKLFRNFSLNEAQKMKVIESFDRTRTVREIKLVYSTLAESFKMPTVANKKVVKESFASKPVASTKPAKQTVISEGVDLAARFKKLAGLKNK